MARACIPVSLLRAAGSPRRCRPSDHLVTVVGTRRLRAGLSRRYWIRCRRCDLEHGPYESWQAAWHDALHALIATRRRAAGRERTAAHDRPSQPMSTPVFRPRDVREGPR